MPDQKKLFITGNSVGLGLALSEVFLMHGWTLCGCSRRGCDLVGVSDVRCDLTDFDGLGSALERLLGGLARLDLVILNAGVLGETKPINELSLEGLRATLDLNLWANKLILDWLMASDIRLDQIVLVSSDMVDLAGRGWAGCALSKAALNMMARLYAHELPHVHISAIAPGLIASPSPEPCQRTSLSSPRQVAERIYKVLPHLREYESGSFINIRKILAPDEYERLQVAAPAAAS
ncbi:MAG: SDR family NAD(P)-dependent oxidoreductase [Gammaproteobacteria bacterium]|nr:SDR family NAD(P)-dependent oxidoreductase [Gammaproteobacteria bacterium]MBU1656346.1 SDR family NAD(P)-dependent oxidoreductase [Gammaproteobacteria bacterium]MBU1959910.1 SDR family NAD(P)-dependent oxidoreductase [Gammaproteobacteria bacterium]